MRVLLCLIPLAFTGCTDCFSGACGDTLGVRGWCAGNDDACSLDGAPVRGIVAVSRGQVLAAPIDRFAYMIRGSRELRVEYFPLDYSDAAVFPALPSKAKARVDIDGVPGKFDGSVYRWEPFPSNPKVFRFSYVDGEVDANVELQFEDHACMVEGAKHMC